MTDRSSEERSRTWTPLVEVIRREMLVRFSDKLSMEEIASCAYAVAALEDRQEAAPTKEPTTPSDLITERCAKHAPHLLSNSADWVWWFDRPPIERLQMIQKLRAESLGSTVPDGPRFATVGQSDVALASGAFRDGCVLSGVPSEATPSKENAPQIGEEHVK